MASVMGKGGPDQDLAVILFSTHGEMIGGDFYLIPYDFDLSTQEAMKKSAVSAQDFAKSVAAIARGEKSCSCSTRAIQVPLRQARHLLTPAPLALL